MSENGYEVAHIDELERLPVDEEGLTWRPVRRRFGIEAFGINAYTAADAGDRVVESHRESEGHQEVYFVTTGQAEFTLGEDTVDAPAGTLVYVSEGTLRGAVAKEAGTTVLAVGAKRGVVFEPSAWEEWFAAFGYLRKGAPRERPRPDARVGCARRGELALALQLRLLRGARRRRRRGGRAAATRGRARRRGGEGGGAKRQRLRPTPRPRRLPGARGVSAAVHSHSPTRTSTLFATTRGSRA